MPKLTSGDIYSQALLKAGFVRVGGADEAGRGACAGPLVAAAVIFADAHPTHLDDSKKLTPQRRESLFDEIMASAIAVGVARVEAADCDRLGM